MSRLHQIIDDALETAPVDHWVTIDAANQLIDHLEMAILDAAGGPDHIVNVKGSAWTCQHPLSERFEGDLFDCKLTTLISLAVWDMRKEGDGQYRVRLDRNALVWDKVTP